MTKYVISYYDGEYDHNMFVETFGKNKLLKTASNVLEGGGFMIIMGIPYPGEFEIKGVKEVEEFPSDDNLMTGKY